MNTEEQNSFERSWRNCEDSLTGYFYRKGCPEEDTKDLMQETAMRGWKNFSSLKGEFKPWIFTIAKRTFIDYLRKRKPTSEIVDNVVVDSRPGPSQHAITKSLLSQCLKVLDPIDRKCLTLHDFEGLNFEKIGEMLGISTSNAHYHANKARSGLRESFPDLLHRRPDRVDKL